MCVLNDDVHVLEEAVILPTLATSGLAQISSGRWLWS